MNRKLQNLTQERPGCPERILSLKSHDGVSIMEILIAILIFSVGVLGMASMQTNATGSNRKSIKLSGATEKGVCVLEELTSLPYDHPSLAAGTTTPAQTEDWIDNNDDGTVDEAGENGDFSVSWEVIQNAIIPDTKTISVTVTSASANNSVNLASVISD